MSIEIDGASIGFSFNGQTLNPSGDDGYVGRLDHVDKRGALITVDIEPDVCGRFHGIEVEPYPSSETPQFRVTAKKNCAAEGGKKYTRKVPILTGEDGPYTYYPLNHFRLLKTGPFGGLETYDVALVSQDNDFFVTAQKVHETRCYLNGGKVACPQFSDWPQMLEFLNDILADEIAELAPISDYKPVPEVVTADGLQGDIARVVWWNYAQGLGLLATPEGAARVHWSQLPKGKTRLRSLKRGQYVVYKRLRPLKSKYSALENEAVGISLMTTAVL